MFLTDITSQKRHVRNLFLETYVWEHELGEFWQEHSGNFLIFLKDGKMDWDTALFKCFSITASIKNVQIFHLRLYWSVEHWYRPIFFCWQTPAHWQIICHGEFNVYLLLLIDVAWTPKCLIKENRDPLSVKLI